MKRSTERMLTTHVGSLARPEELLDLMRSRALGESYDEQMYERAVRRAVAACVRDQVDSGLDSVSDGEQGKIGHAVYIGERLEGFERHGDSRASLGKLFEAEIAAFPGYYEQYFSVAMAGGAIAPSTPLSCIGPVSYKGHDAIKRDLANFRDAVDALDHGWQGEAFVPAIAPSKVGTNRYYDSEAEYLFAVADALRIEYEAIVDAGFILQIDDPYLTEIYGLPGQSLAEAHHEAEVCVEAINRAIRNIPAEKIRFHTCYGVNEGPRVHDVELSQIIEVVLGINAGAYLFEAANPRHEHEYHVWERVSLPEGKLLIPGVITHSTNIVEHPELIAERIIRFADRVGRENVIAGTDCGFASQASYRHEVHPTVVRAKLQALAEGARIASSRLW